MRSFELLCDAVVCVAQPSPCSRYTLYISSYRRVVVLLLWLLPPIPHCFSTPSSLVISAVNCIVRKTLPEETSRALKLSSELVTLLRGHYTFSRCFKPSDQRMAYSYVLALAVPKEGNVINKVQANKKKSREDVVKEKTSVEDYCLERSKTDIGTGKTKPKRKRISKSQILKVSPCFTNDCENKAEQNCGSEFESAMSTGAREKILQEKGEGNGDEIAIERIKFRRKRTSKKHELVESDEASSLFQSDNGKVDAGSLDCDAGAGFVAVPDSCVSLLVDKQQEIFNEVESGKVKFKKKKKQKAFEGKLHESGYDTKTLYAVRYVSPYFHNDGGKKLEQQGFESHVDSVALTATYGDFFKCELQESGKEIESVAVKTKVRRKSKSHKTAEDHAEIPKVSTYFQNDIKKTVNVEAVDDRSSFHSVLFTCGDILQDKVKENGDKIAISMIKSKGKRTSKKHEPVEHDQFEKVSPFFQSDSEKLDAESHCAGGCFLEGNVMEKGNIKSKKKKKKKAIADTVQENGNSAENSGVKSKKQRLKVHKTIADGAVRYVSPYFHKGSRKKIYVKPLDVERKSVSIVLPTSANIMEDKLQDNGSEMKIKQQEREIHVNSGELFEDKLQESGKEIETIAIKSKKRKTGNQKTAKEIRKVSPYFQNSNKKTVSAEAPDDEGEFNSVASGTCANIVQDNGEENGYIVAKRIKPKAKKISTKHEPLEHAQIRKFSPFFQSGIEKKADIESCYGSEIGSIALSGCGGSFLEDRSLQNQNVTEIQKIKSNKRKAIADKLQENGNDTETSNVNYKKTTPLVQKHIANGAVRYVSPYFHNDSGKEINVKTCNKECKSESVALSTRGKLREDKLQETHGKKNKQKGLESHFGSVALPASSSDLLEDELQENGNGVVTFETFSYKRNSESQKTLEHGKVRKVSPYFRTKCISGCEQVEKVKKVRKNVKVTDSRTCVNSKVKGNRRKTSGTTKRPLSASEKKAEAYKRRTPDNTWKPPRSPFNLLQEDHAHNPWRVLVICMLLNLTTGTQAKRILSDLFNLCPDAQTCTQVATEEIEKVIQSLGLQKKRSVALQRLSREYLDESWTHVTQLHGVGKYGADAYAIFCTGKWDQVRPTDSVLNKYWDFLHMIKETL